MALPFMIELNGRDVLIVGGGAVALRRATKLSNDGARVHIVAPACVDALRELARARDGVVWTEAAWSDELLVSGAYALVVAATSDPSVNAAVCARARVVGVLANRVDHAVGGDLSFMASVELEDIVIGVSTRGASPIAARLLTGAIERDVLPGWRIIARVLGELRGQLSALSNAQRGIYAKRVYAQLTSNSGAPSEAEVRQAHVIAMVFARRPPE